VEASDIVFAPTLGWIAGRINMQAAPDMIAWN